MEEKIEKILLSHIEAVTEKNSPFAPTAINGVPRSAKEIASHFRGFILWTHGYKNDHCYRCGIGWRIPHLNKDEPLKEYNLDELYSYWLKEVKK